MTIRRRARRVCLGLIALLYIFSVPWYRDTNAPLDLWLGLPDWVAVALCCYAAVACLNAVAWLLADVSDSPAAPDIAETSRTSDAIHESQGSSVLQKVAP